MTKLMVIPSRKEEIKKTLTYADAYLIGIDDFSVNFGITFSFEEVKEIKTLLDKEGKELFVSLNKNMFSKDLKQLENLLLKLETLKLKGIGYYDISVVSISKRLNLKTPLVWSQEHFTTNYLTMNYWYDLGVSYSYLSSEITKEEIEEISKKTKMKLIVPIFGYIPMFFSKRPLITNYQKYFNLKKEKGNYYIEKSDRKYPIVEKKIGLEVYYDKVLNAYLEYLEMNVEYATFNSYKMEEETFLKVLEIYKNKKGIEELQNLIPLESCFLTKKTVYRVKDL